MWVTFTGRDTGKKIRFNIDNISAVSEMECGGKECVLIEVLSGKDFWVAENFAVVNQEIDARVSRGG